MTLALDPPAAIRPAPPGGLAGYALSLAMVAAATFAAVAMQQRVGAPNTSLVFVLPVIAAAVAFGWRPALVAAVTGVAAYNFFLIPPLYSLRVDAPQNAWALAILLVVAVVASAVAAQSRRWALEAEAAADQAEALQSLARSLAGALDRAEIARACAEALARLFRAPALVLLEDADRLAPAALTGGAQPTPADLEAASWSLAGRLPTRGGAYPAPDAAFDFWPVTTRRRQGAVIGLAISGRDAGRPPAPERLVEVVGGYLAVALDREAYAREVLDARLERAGEQLKTDLLAAVSHDLRTPLSTVLFSLQSLRAYSGEHDPAARDDLIRLAETETARLAGLVDNLLDMNRLDAGAVRPRIEPAAAGDLIERALAQAKGALGGRRVERNKAKGPRLNVDAGLFESALAKVLENAGRYGPEGSAIRIRTGAENGMGWIDVEDEGPGFPATAEPLFGRFVRGAAGDGRPPGLGLGLTIAQGFLAAMGGRIEAADRPDGRGARVRLSAPAA